jgi:hypothetical protein
MKKNHKTICLVVLLAFASPVAFALPKSLSLVVEGRGSYQVNLETSMLTRTQGKNILNRKLSSAEVLGVQAEATRLLWQAKYRSPASMKKCATSLKVEVEQETAKVCPTNAAAAGAAMALLYRLDLMASRP